MSFDFDFSKAERATKKQARLRMALHGPSGAGKTYSALAIGEHLGDRLFVLDTEHGSASKYADRFKFDSLPGPLKDFHPERLISFLQKGAERYDVLIVDSMTHFWNAQSGFLELVDAEVAKMRAKGGRGDSHTAWKEVDKLYRRLVYAIHGCGAHVIFTLRAKMEYAREEENGKTKIRKVGLAPQMRDEFQYEADIEGMLNIDHELVIGKTRCEAVDGQLFKKPGKEFASVIKAWLEDGAPAVPMTVKVGGGDELPPSDPPWLVEVIALFGSAENEADLKVAQGKAQEHKSEIVGTVRDRVMAASADAKKRIGAQAAQ
jgi:hypothetical protein